MAKDEQKDDININQAQDWARLQQDWVRGQMQRAQAHADRFFTTDDEMPLGPHILLVAIVGFFILFVVWANFATLDEVTRGDGRIIPSSEVQVVQNLEGGIVDEFMVREGDEVQAGQVLMRLRDIDAASNLGANQSKYMGLMAAISRLKAEAEGRTTPDFPDDVMKNAPTRVTEEMDTFRANQQSLKSQTVIYEQQLVQREQEVRELNTRITDLRGVIALSRQERDMISPLVERGSAPRVELIQLERGLRERESELNGLNAALPRAQSAVAEARARIAEISDSFKAQAQTELSAKTIEANALRETLTSLQDRRVRTEIRSPVNGTIKEIKVKTVGGVVQPGQDLVEIVPRDDQLLVEAQIRPGDIAFLHPGQDAMIKITAYDFSIYGGLKGALVDISADTITNEKGESFYRVRLRTHETELKRKGEVLPIIPGMVASVDILTGKKTVMEYILKPFIKTLNNALSER